MPNAPDGWGADDEGRDHEPGFRFDRWKDRLIVVDQERVRLVNGWPELRAVERRHRRRRWQEFHPRFPVVLPSAQATVPSSPRSSTGQQVEPLADQRRRALASFRGIFPNDIASAVERFRSHQWPLLHALRQSYSLIELASDNPALFYLFACKHWYASLHGRLPTLDGISRRHIANHLGFPGSRGVVKILRKVEPESVCVSDWDTLRAVFAEPNHPAMKSLQHMPTVNLGVLSILMNDRIRSWAAPALLEQVAELSAERYRARIANRLETVAEMFSTVHPDCAPRPARSLDELDDLYRELRETFVEAQEAREIAEAARAKAGRFPQPPLPDLDHQIVALSSARALEREGEEQSNCVATYADRVVSGRCFIYKVTTPQRCTLAIKPTPSGGWAISELEVADNTAAEATTHRFVQSWIDHNAVLA